MCRASKCRLRKPGWVIARRATGAPAAIPIIVLARGTKKKRKKKRKKKKKKKKKDKKGVPGGWGARIVAHAPCATLRPGRARQAPPQHGGGISFRLVIFFLVF